MLFFSYIGMIYYPISYLFGAFPQLQRYETRLKTFYEEFEVLETEEHLEGENLEKISGNIDFKNVNFSYNEERQILQNLSFSIKK